MTKGQLGPRILIIGAEAFADRPGGLNRYAGSLADALGRDTPCRIVTSSRGPTPSGGDSDGAVRRVARTMVAVTRTGRASDVVDSHFALYGLLPVLTLLRRKPLVVHFQGPWADESLVSAPHRKVSSRVKWLVERMVYRRAAVVVTLSEAFRSVASARYAIDSGKIVVIPAGVDLERFSPSSQTSAREALNLDPTAFLVVCARRLDPRMGIDVLVDAWAAVVGQVPNAHLVIAGVGAEGDALRLKVAERGLARSVELPGSVSDRTLVDLFRAANCSVVPTRSLEGFGLVVLESLACGTPAVVTDIGGLPEVVRDLDASLVVPAEDPEALADRLVSAANGRLPTRSACRAYAERFAWATVAEAHTEVYGSLVERPIKVTYVDHTAELSGGELALARLLRGLRTEVNATALLGAQGPLVRELELAGVSVEVLPLADGVAAVRRGAVGRFPGIGVTADAALYVVRLARKLRSSRPDLVHTNSLKAAIYGGLAGRLAGVPVVWHIRDRITDDYLPRRAVTFIRLLGWLLPSVIVANSDATAATLARQRVPIHIVSSPIDIGATRRRHRQEGPTSFVMLGRLASWKGQHVFLRAFAQVFANDRHARCLIAGGALFAEEEYEDELRRLVQELGLEGRVEFLGHVGNVGQLLAQADVLVHASIIPEPFGQVVVEGMAAGLAVIATDGGGPSEYVESGNNGILVPPNDQAALAAAMKELVDPALRQRLGDAAVVTAARFAPARIAAEMATVYSMTLKAKAQPWRR